MLGRPVVSYANGREIVITFGQQEAQALPRFPDAAAGRRSSRRESAAGSGPKAR